MTEEIINGIDVSECCFYNNGKCDNPNGMACNCINNAVCYFKEFKRLEFELKITKADYEASEQENKELKAYKDVNEDFKKAWDELNRKYTEVLKLAKENADSNEYCLQELEQENKELKEMLSKEPKAMQAFQISYSGLKRDNEILWGMAKDYKTALEEISEILKPYLTECQGFLCEPINEVLNKINEVLE